MRKPTPPRPRPAAARLSTYVLSTSIIKAQRRHALSSDCTQNPCPSPPRNHSQHAAMAWTNWDRVLYVQENSCGWWWPRMMVAATHPDHLISRKDWCYFGAQHPRSLAAVAAQRGEDAGAQLDSPSGLRWHAGFTGSSTKNNIQTHQSARPPLVEPTKGYFPDFCLVTFALLACPQSWGWVAVSPPSCQNYFHSLFLFLAPLRSWWTNADLSAELMATDAPQ